MRKRLRKKVSKYRCLKCGSTSGVRSIYQLKSGRWIEGELNCSYCVIGVTRDPVELQRIWEEFRDFHGLGNPALDKISSEELGPEFQKVIDDNWEELIDDSNK